MASTRQSIISTAAAGLLWGLGSANAAADEGCGEPTSTGAGNAGELAPGESFRDCPVCPEMVVVPPGRFKMGDLSGDGRDRERPVHVVTIGEPFAVGKYEVTFDEWDACVDDGGCSHRPDDLNWGRGRRAIGDVSWNDAKEYVRWLSCRTGADYRLPSETEWEYMARAGSETRFPWGDHMGTGNALCLHCGGDFPQTTPVGQFPPNDFGIHDTAGSVSEWVEDCLNNSYEGAPTDGSAWTEGNCRFRMVRGGGWYGEPKFLTSSYRNYKTVDARVEIRGLRVARDIARQ